MATTTTVRGIPQVGMTHGTDRAGQSAGDGTTTGDPHGHGDGTIRGAVLHGIPDGGLLLHPPIVPDGAPDVRALDVMTCAPADCQIRVPALAVARHMAHLRQAGAHTLLLMGHPRLDAEATHPQMALRHPDAEAIHPPTGLLLLAEAATPLPTTEVHHRPVAAATHPPLPDAVAAP